MSDTSNLIAIQTIYKGYKFRSQLEARWAVFLDYLDAKWSYEKEGFHLESTLYLPDFFVEDWDCWIEIKGKSPTEEENEKCRLLALHSKKRVLLISGEPWMENNKNFYEITLYESDREDLDETSGWEFGEGRRCSEEIWLVKEMNAFTLRAIPHLRDDKFPLSGEYAKSILQALSLARKARFEYGEQNN